MSLSKEWTEWHLTPRGWESGSTRIDFGNVTEKEPPKDRVLSFRYKEVLTSAFSKADISTEELWRSENSELIQKLLNKYGNCPQSL